MKYCVLLISLFCSTTFAAEPGWKSITALGDGYVVWESNRSGQFRIWKRQLDGSSLTMLTPDDGHEHYAPHISPNGQRIAYYRYARGTSVYSKKINPVRGETALCLMNHDGSGLRELTQNARIAEAGGDRGVVWMDDDRLIFVNWSGAPCIYHLSSGRVETLAETQEACLINAPLSHAFKRVSFMPFDPSKRKISSSKGFGGCEAYVSHDGDWGFWMGGAGGPVNRIHLRTGEVSEIYKKRDPLFPVDRNYIYFPMSSRCGRLFACAVSPKQHDHFTSDYEIYVASMNPQSFSIISKPVRYTFDAATDRYPDVYQEPLELPLQMGEAPLTVRYSAAGTWIWDFGNGSVGHGGKVEHQYTEAGIYTVRARSGTRHLRGQVMVEPATPPEAISILLHAANEIEVVFDESVELVNPKSRLIPAATITATRYGQDHHSLIFTLDRPVPAHARFYLEGVQDMAPHPNKLDPFWLDMHPLAWPFNLNGLSYVFQTADKPNKIHLPNGEVVSYAMKSRDRARLDHNFAMVLDHGAYVVEGANEALLKACQTSSEISIELVVKPHIQALSGLARIISFSKSPDTRNFALSQDDDELVLHLRTSQNREEAQINLCSLDIGTAQHILVSYRDGQLAVYKHGKLIHSGDELMGDFSSWELMQIIFGDDMSGHHDWSGTLEGVAIYNRFIEASEALQTFRQYYNIHKARKQIPSAELDVTLIEKSPVPTLDEISPYKEGLGMIKYKVNAVLSGSFTEKEIYVAHWLIMDNQTLAAAKRQPGDRLRIRVERFDENPQLISFFCRDDFSDGDALLAERYFALE